MTSAVDGVVWWGPSETWLTEGPSYTESQERMFRVEETACANPEEGRSLEWSRAGRQVSALPGTEWGGMAGAAGEACRARPHRTGKALLSPRRDGIQWQVCIANLVGLLKISLTCRNHPGPCYFRCGLGAGSLSMTWELGTPAPSLLGVFLQALQIVSALVEIWGALVHCSGSWRDLRGMFI